MIDMNHWCNQQLQSKQRIAIPIMTHPGIEMTGYRIIDAVQNGRIHAEAIRKISAVYPVAASTTMMDLTLEAEAFGCKIEFQPDEMPHILGRLVTNAEDVGNLKVPGLGLPRLQQFCEASKIAIAHLSDKPVFGGVVGPFSLASRLYDMSELMVACCTEPETVACLLEKCTEFILNYCQELKKIGCNGVIMAEPAAGLLSNEDCEVFSSTYVKRLVENLQDKGFLVILHNCGNHGNCTRAMLNTGAKVLHFGNSIDIVKTLEMCPEDILIMGNIDPVGIMKMKPAQEVRDCVSEVLRATSTFRNFILSTGCDLPTHVPLKNIDAFFDALRVYNQDVIIKEESLFLKNVLPQ